MRQSRAWDRYRRLLESGADIVATVERAVGDEAALQALRQELPAFLESRGQASYVQPALETLDRLERPLLRPVERKGRDLLAELNRGMSHVRMDFSHVEMELTGQWERTTLLLGWEGKSVQVADPL